MSDNKPKDHIYMMPGLAANSQIFENIKISNRRYQLYKIDWIKPKLNEDLKDYCKRLSIKIKHKNVIFLGVSFGGIIVQELSKIVETKKIIIVSSVKSHKEFPKFFKLAKHYGLNKPIPYSLFDSLIKNSVKFKLNKFYKRIDLAEKYLSER